MNDVGEGGGAVGIGEVDEGGDGGDGAVGIMGAGGDAAFRINRLVEVAIKVVLVLPDRLAEGRVLILRTDDWAGGDGEPPGGVVFRGPGVANGIDTANELAEGVITVDGGGALTCLAGLSIGDGWVFFPD